MKTNKRKNILLASMLLGSVALSTVGFAAWVIVGGDEGKVEGQFKVDVIEDESHDITATMTDNEVTFGAKAKSEEVTNSWLAFETSENDEDLVASFTVTITNIQSTTKEGVANEITCTTILSEVDTDESEDTKYYYAEALAKGYVAELPQPVLAETEVNTTDKTATLTYTITFKWGTYFGGNNPIDYYNGFAKDDEKTEGVTYAEDAMNVLNGDVFKNLAKAKYKVDVEVAHKVAAK